MGRVGCEASTRTPLVQDELFAARGAADRAESEIGDTKESIAVLEDTNGRADAALASDKQVWAEKTRAALEEVDMLEARLHQLKTADSSTLSESQRTMEDMHAEYSTLSQRYQAEKVQMNEALLFMTSELADHREYTKANLDSLAAKAEDILKEVSLEEDA